MTTAFSTMPFGSIILPETLSISPEQLRLYPVPPDDVRSQPGLAEDRASQCQVASHDEGTERFGSRSRGALRSTVRHPSCRRLSRRRSRPSPHPLRRSRAVRCIPGTSPEWRVPRTQLTLSFSS